MRRCAPLLFAEDGGRSLSARCRTPSRRGASRVATRGFESRRLGSHSRTRERSLPVTTRTQQGILMFLSRPLQVLLLLTCCVTPVYTMQLHGALGAGNYDL